MNISLDLLKDLKKSTKYNDIFIFSILLYILYMIYLALYRILN